MALAVLRGLGADRGLTWAGRRSIRPAVGGGFLTSLLRRGWIDRGRGLSGVIFSVGHGESPASLLAILVGADGTDRVPGGRQATPNGESCLDYDTGLYVRWLAVNGGCPKPGWERMTNRKRHGVADVCVTLMLAAWMLPGSSRVLAAQTDSAAAPGSVIPGLFQQAPATQGYGVAGATPSASQPQSQLQSQPQMDGPNGSPAGQPSGTPNAARDTRSQAERNDALRQRQNAPDRLTDFQQLILQTTGQQVPIFGASLFTDAPSTFAPVEDIPVTPDYVVGPGDELRLQLWGQVNREGAYTVDRSGSISVPQLGTVHVAGVRAADLNSFLRSQFSRVYRNFDLNANLGQLRSIQIFVVGQARHPGSYTISSLSTLLNALLVSGGASPQGSLRDIQLRRGSEPARHFDLYDLLLRGDKSKDQRLLPGDVIFIPPVGPQVALLGSVNNPAIYELRSEAGELRSGAGEPGSEAGGETKLADLLALSGGASNLASEAEIRLERVYEHELRSITTVSAAERGSVALRNGDVISVISIIDRFRNAVTLRGNVANPGRYPWRAGMHVTDLLPSKEALITRDYWLRRNQLGIGLSPRESAQPAATEGSLQVAASATPGGGASTSRGAASTPGSSGSASGGGNSVASALASTGALFAPATDVVLSAPDIDWSYAVVERQSADTLKTSLIPFNLGRAVMDHDATQNPELLPNDVVTIFSTADIRVPIAQQTRFVRLEGEFKAAGVYSVQPGETLRQLVARAGGFTPDAYLYASQFTRISTQRVERQRLSDYADQLEAQVTAVNARNSSRAVSDLDTSASASATSSARAAIARLRQLDPIGRIVLQLKPDSEGDGALPDLALEDGDRFIVPKISSNVYVEGQVYSANAFVFEPGRRTTRYLKLAGGPDREADKSRSFILRADGSVLSRQYADVNHALIFPGDTIVMPPMISKRALLRDLVDISSVIGQFGIGVAAINVLK